MIRRPPGLPRTSTPFPYTTLFRSDGKAAAPKPATNADRSPLLGTGRGLPRQDERESSYAHEPPFRPRRNPAKVWTMAAVLFALAIGILGGALYYFGTPSRSAERRVGNECVSRVRSRGWADQYKK